MATISGKRSRRRVDRRKDNSPGEEQQLLPFMSLSQMRKPAKRASDAPMKKYPMSGVTVEFPFQPYPAQIQMMSKIVKALKEKKNALLESPTGSGKSLAILCASIAWSEYEKNRQLAEETARQVIVLDDKPGDNNKNNDDDIMILSSTTTTLNPSLKRGFSEDDDFKPVQLPSKIIKLEQERRSKSASPAVSIDGEDGYDDSNNSKEESTETNSRVSKIYIGSRTHKQLSQLVGELKGNTHYRPKMSVLGSREHYCIEKKVKKAQDKGEACTALLDADLCSFSNKVGKVVANSHIRKGGDREVWDIEDLTQIGQAVGGCPYFASRTLAESAEIIFCPYNYLLDPLIRSSMDIDLKDHVVVLDEAHNIEDVARSCGSFELTETQLRIVSIELSRVVRHPSIAANSNSNLKNAYQQLFLLTDTMTDFMNEEPKNPTIKRDNYEERRSIWNDKDLLSKLSELHISQSTLNTITSAHETVAEQMANMKRDKEGKSQQQPDEWEEQNDSFANDNIDNGNPEENKKTQKCISVKSHRLFEGLIMIFKFIFSEQGTREKDYSMALIKKIDRQQTRRTKTADWEIKLAFWCLNPAIVFRNMAQETRSIILTSGTLSPLNTFASELETEFPIRLEANHVIDRSQVWIRSIVQGPGSVVLHGTWERASQFQYQDSVGQSLCEISEIIPYGILCFVPSYNAMEKLIERWKTTGLYDRLDQRKHIVCEPSGKGSKDVFEQLMNNFYYYISDAETNQGKDGRKDGAILFAVYRGKVSEGIDFTDNNCRAVVALGIPFPNIKDVQVELKKDYNTKRCKDGEHVLDGGGWYRTQAYRAINQALGRCIRHRRDWGAIILLESRFSEAQNVSQLSKWVRPLCATETSYANAIVDLREFAEKRLGMDRKTKQEKAAATEIV
ncbi:helicase C-terminal domain-containing protein [Zychaea mexicana]|uniref:helicase C-terminal domain-containing protein n=1 Tax=Zychaea mexicana TaxID=64656 RepID=UPI0022FE8B03|nr:helicase C-terminal domain-containing protein [Zychaea mexicana]KAI9495389.1 helicase C-terminal domain-containing protein [Zychaea mexicana]